MLTEDTALATLIIDLKKRRKIDNPLKDAECCEYLQKLYGSSMAVAKKLQISNEMIREFVRIAYLPEEVKQLIKQGLIRGVDIPYRISLLENDAEKIDLAKIIATKKLPANDVRDIIYLKRKRPDFSIKNCVQQVLEAKPQKIEVCKIVSALSDETFQKLRSQAKNLKVIPENLAKRIFEETIGLQNIVSFEIHDNKIIIMKLRGEDYRAFKNYAKALKVPLEYFVEFAINNGLKKGSSKINEMKAT